jgi:hypothetical protein
MEMPLQPFDIKRRCALFVILCLSCVLAVSCKTQEKIIGPEGSGLGRAEEDPTPVEHDLDHPPQKGVRIGRETTQKTADSTPTPTPNRAIDRPLDPVGKPLTSPTPDG